MGLRAERLRAPQVRAATLEAFGEGGYVRGLEAGLVDRRAYGRAGDALRCAHWPSIDSRPAAVDAARERLTHDRTSASVRGAVRESPADGPFDLVVGSEVLYYLVPASCSPLRPVTTRASALGGRLVAVHFGPRTSVDPMTGLDVHAAPRRAWVAPRSQGGPTIATCLTCWAHDATASLIVGGGPAGLSAARAYRDADGEGDVGDRRRAPLPYRRPPLTKELLRGEMSADELPLEDESWFAEQRRSTARAGARSRSTATRARSVRRRASWPTPTASWPPVAEPRRLPIPGADDPAVRVLRPLDHAPGPRAPPCPAATPSSWARASSAARSRRRCAPAVSRSTLGARETAPSAAAGRQRRSAAGVADRRRRASTCGTGRDGAVRAAARARARAATGARTPTVVMAAGVAPRVELAAAAGLELDDGAVAVDARDAHGDSRRLRRGRRRRRGQHRRRPAAARRALGRRARAGRGRRAARSPARRRSGARLPGFWSTVGDRTLKHAAWGDGWDAAEAGGRRRPVRLVAGTGAAAEIVGVLAPRRRRRLRGAAQADAEGAPELTGLRAVVAIPRTTRRRYRRAASAPARAGGAPRPAVTRSARPRRLHRRDRAAARAPRRHDLLLHASTGPPRARAPRAAPGWTAPSRAWRRPGARRADRHDRRRLRSRAPDWLAAPARRSPTPAR